MGGGPLTGPIAQVALDTARTDQEAAIQKLKVNPKLRGGAESTDAPPASCLE